ncbi:MAG TPA: 50S ribosomal protein L18 [Candidatus Limnocylindria bacterium]|jgi:large subunit ribosomal protein L18|nr:50S ribosomal protein L18 [Candidatus Limnocylindria bacterium]
MRTEHKQRLAQLRHWRVRKKVAGSAERPRMSVKFTGQHIYVQFIDDTIGRTLAAVSTSSKTAPAGVKGANVASAIIVGKAAAEAAKAKGVEAVVLDRGSAKYHGKLKALADAAREAGLKF